MVSMVYIWFWFWFWFLALLFFRVVVVIVLRQGPVSMTHLDRLLFIFLVVVVLTSSAARACLDDTPRRVAFSFSCCCDSPYELFD